MHVVKRCDGDGEVDEVVGVGYLRRGVAGRGGRKRGSGGTRGGQKER